MSWTPAANDAVYADAYYSVVHALENTYIESGMAVTATGSDTILTVASGVHYIDGTRYSFAGDSIDVASERPSTAGYKLLIVLWVDSAGTLTVVSGTEVANDDDMQVQDLSGVTGTMLARVKLTQGANVASADISDSCRFVRGTFPTISNGTNILTFTNLKDAHDQRGSQIAGNGLTWNVSVLDVTNGSTSTVGIVQLSTSTTSSSSSLAATASAVKSVQDDVNGFPDELKNLIADEVTQLQNIDGSTISIAQWGYLGALNQGLTTTSTVSFNTVNATTVSATTITGTTIGGITSTNLVDKSASETITGIWSYTNASGISTTKLTSSSQIVFSGLGTGSWQGDIIPTNDNIYDIGANSKRVANIYYAAPTTASSANAYIDASTGLVSRSTSSARYKSEISDYNPDTSVVLELELQQFKHETSGWNFGYIAEQAYELDPHLAITMPDKDGKGVPDALDMNHIIFYLIEEVKKLRKEINELK